MCYEFEAKNLLLVLGEYIWEQQVIPPAEQWQTGVTQRAAQLGKYAADLGLEIALELEPFKLSLLNNVDSMVRFLDDVDHPAVQANIDISHLQLAQVPPEELRRLQGQGDPRPHHRLRRQGPRRPAAGPRRGRLRARTCGRSRPWASTGR